MGEGEDGELLFSEYGIQVLLGKYIRRLVVEQTRWNYILQKA